MDGSRNGLAEDQGPNGTTTILGCVNGERQIRLPGYNGKPYTGPAKPKAPVPLDGPVVTEPCTPQPAFFPAMPTTASAMPGYLAKTQGVRLNDINDVAKVVGGIFQSDYLLPAQRAALYEFLATMPGLTLERNVKDVTGRPGIGVGWSFRAATPCSSSIRSTYTLLGVTTWGEQGEVWRRRPAPDGDHEPGRPAAVTPAPRSSAAPVPAGRDRGRGRPRVAVGPGHPPTAARSRHTWVVVRASCMWRSSPVMAKSCRTCFPAQTTCRLGFRVPQSLAAPTSTPRPLASTKLTASNSTMIGFPLAVGPASASPKHLHGGDVYLPSHRDERELWFLADLHGQPIAIHAVPPVFPAPPVRPALQSRQ